MNVIQVRIEGAVPLLQHRYAVADKSESPGVLRPGMPKWEKEAETAAYRDPAGKLYQPADHIEAAMVKAAANVKIPGKDKKTYKSLFQTAVEVHPTAIPHIYQDSQTDARGVVIKRNRVIRYRPRLDKWALEFEIHVLEEQLDVRVVRDVLDYAGRAVGIGDYRPKFGRFTVTHWEVTKLAAD